jgi:hypothetical protein
MLWQLTETNLYLKSSLSRSENSVTYFSPPVTPKMGDVRSIQTYRYVFKGKNSKYKLDTMEIVSRTDVGSLSPTANVLKNNDTVDTV